MSERRTIVVAGAAALALLLAGGWVLAQRQSSDIFAPCHTGIASANASVLGGPFTMTDESGARVTDKEVFATPTIFYFGYTFCPDVCPTDSARNARATDILAERGIKVRPVFVSVDPKRDTPARLGEFTDLFHPDMLGLTGTAAEIAAAAKSWRVIYDIKDQEDKHTYLVDHTVKSYLVLPGHGTVAVFDRDETPDAMADRAACYIGAAKAQDLTQP